MGKWPKLAYYWPTDDLISASDAIKKRERDNRTGVIWCHAECYKANPKNGNALFARRGPGSPHFWLGPGNFTKYVGCDFEIFKSRNSESYRYSQILHDLYNWLNSNDAKKDLGLVSVNKALNKKGSDISLNHTIIGEIPREQTNILIRDKNRKRTGNSSNTLVIDICQWPDSHFQDFENYAKRLFLEEWDRLNQKKKIVVRTPQFNRNAPERTRKGWKRRWLTRQELVAEQLSVSTETVYRLDQIRLLLGNVMEAHRKDHVKKIREEAKNRFGELPSSKKYRDEFISSQIADKLNNIEDLSRILADASTTIRINHERRGSPNWLEGWDNLLMSITPEDYTLGENGDFQKIMSKYQSCGGLDFERDVELLHRSLITKNTPFFDFVAPEGGKKGFVAGINKRTWCLYKGKKSTIQYKSIRLSRRSPKVSHHSMEDVIVLFEYNKEDFFFKEVFKACESKPIKRISI